MSALNKAKEWMVIMEEKECLTDINSTECDERIFHTLIKEICGEKGISCTKLSYDWILELKKGDKVYHITGNRFDLNKEAAGHVACDKYATYEVLKSNNIPKTKKNAEIVSAFFCLFFSLFY